MPYIVHVERGVLNRAIYDMAVLFDPSSGAAEGGLAAWNRKLLWSFGGGSGTPYKQFAPNSTWQVDYALARGYLVAVSAHTDQQLNSNHVVAAETVMMGKEHVIERYGEIKYTIGTGCSGGSIMQLQLASLYPGLLDGIQPSCTYPDSYSTGMEVGDCVMLDSYFASPEFATLTKELTPAQVVAKKAAIAGHMDEKACRAWALSYGSSNNPGVYTHPRTNKSTNNCHLLDSQVYDAAKNPNGVRCSIAEYAIATWGAMPGTRIARRTNDNVGIQYGLKALAAGQIGADEFVTLNEKIGGTDLDMNLTAQRMVADDEALRIAYQDGIIGDAKQWAKVPIIDWRGNDNSNIHMNWRAFAVRERLDRVNGGHGNQVDLALRPRAVAAAAPDGRIAGDDRQVGGRDQGGYERGAARRKSVEEPAGGSVRLLLHRQRLHDEGDGLGQVRRGPGAEIFRLAAPGRGRPARGRRAQVPAEAAEPQRLRDVVQRRAVGAAEQGVRERCLRLEQAGSGHAAGHAVANVRERPGRRADGGSAAVEEDLEESG